jgi:FdhD protein
MDTVTFITRVGPQGITEVEDTLAVEEPLEIRIGSQPVSVTMRTPGEDFDLAAGFLFTESILQSGADLHSIRHWGSANVVRVRLREGVDVDLQRLKRHFYATSSCGVCGKSSIDAVHIATSPLARMEPVSHDLVRALPELLRSRQTQFATNGAIHGAGVFAADGTLLRVREDVGRHNAVDKVIGSFVRERASLDGTILCISGRAGFEIVQKAIVARIPMLVAVGAPSTLAVDLAREMNLTLIGFVRNGRFNVYS